MSTLAHRAGRRRAPLSLPIVALAALQLTACSTLTPRERHATDIGFAIGAAVLVGSLAASRHHDDNDSPDVALSSSPGPQVRP